MFKSVIILGYNDELSYCCTSCFDEKKHRKLGECEFNTNEECDVCGGLISYRKVREVVKTPEKPVAIVPTRITWRKKVSNLWARISQYFRGR